MRKVAELLVAARGRVALQGMDRASNIADDLGIRGLLLHEQAFFVESLQEFLRALEEEVAEFVCPFVCEKVHCHTKATPVPYPVLPIVDTPCRCPCES